MDILIGIICVSIGICIGFFIGYKIAENTLIYKAVEISTKELPSAQPELGKWRAGMRIVSQDKMTDTPYDGAVVYVHRRTGNQIYVGNVGDDEGFPIGTYNSKEDAVDVMDQIRNCYSAGREYFYMPTKGEMIEGGKE